MPGSAPEAAAPAASCLCDSTGELAATSRARIAQRPQVASAYVVLCILALPNWRACGMIVYFQFTVVQAGCGFIASTMPAPDICMLSIMTALAAPQFRDARSARRQDRLLAIALAASIALHIAAIASLPRASDEDDTSLITRTLDV